MNRLLLITTLVCLTLLTGCSPGVYVGGGWMPSATGANQKATFGFVIQGFDEDGDGEVDSARGEFQYIDMASNVMIHERDFQAGVTNFAGVQLSSISFFGPNDELREFPVDGDRYLQIGAVDAGAPGASPEDTLFVSTGTVEVTAFSILLVSEYMNFGPIGGGNITQIQ